MMYYWLANLFGKRRTLRPAPHLAAVAAHNSVLWPDLAAAAAQALVYQQSPWVYVAINRIAEAAALVPLRVLRRQGERRLEVERHPLEILLDSPNPYLSRFELFEQTIGMLELTGNAYWFLAGDDGGRPAQIWPLRPDRVTIVPDPIHHVKGYVYEIDGQRIPLEAIEVVHFKRWHPANDYYGLSALEAARLAIASDKAMATWNFNTFGKENGVPAGVVSIKSPMTDADYERIKQDWRATFGGPQRRTAFLRADLFEWQNVGLSHNELDFLRGREAHRNEILNSFGIPVGLVSENATEANAQVAERLFIERTLWPKLVRLAQKITQELLPFWPGDYLAEFEDIRPTDANARLEEIRAAYPVLSINEIRARYFRLPAVSWGDLPVGSQPSPDSVGVGLKPALNPPVLAAPTSADPDITPAAAEPAPDPAKAALDELACWERFALRRLGRSGGRPFEIRALSDELAFEVAANLLSTASPNEVRAVFHDARQSLLAPGAASLPPVPVITPVSPAPPAIPAPPVTSVPPPATSLPVVPTPAAP